MGVPRLGITQPDNQTAVSRPANTVEMTFMHPSIGTRVPGLKLSERRPAPYGRRCGPKAWREPSVQCSLRSRRASKAVSGPRECP